MTVRLIYRMECNNTWLVPNYCIRSSHNYTRIFKCTGVRVYVPTLTDVIQWDLLHVCDKPDGKSQVLKLLYLDKWLGIVPSHRIIRVYKE